jgi:hypothetical protein
VSFGAPGYPLPAGVRGTGSSWVVLASQEGLAREHLTPALHQAFGLAASPDANVFTLGIKPVPTFAPPQPEDD